MVEIVRVYVHFAEMNLPDLVIKHQEKITPVFVNDGVAIPSVGQDEKIPPVIVFRDDRQHIKVPLGTPMTILHSGQSRISSAAGNLVVVVDIDRPYIMGLCLRPHNKMPRHVITDRVGAGVFFCGIQPDHILDGIIKCRPHELWRFSRSNRNPRPDHHEDSNTIRSFAPRKWGWWAWFWLVPIKRPRGRVLAVE